MWVLKQSMYKDTKLKFSINIPNKICPIHIQQQTLNNQIGISEVNDTERITSSVSFVIKQ